MAQAADPASKEPAKTDAAAEFTALYNTYAAKYEPLFKAAELAGWEANTTGTDASFAKLTEAQNALVELHHDHATFLKLKGMKESSAITDPLLKRQLEVMYRAFLAGEADPKIQKRLVAIEAEIVQIFNLHRSTVDGRPLTENEVRAILSGSNDPKQAEKAWKAYMEVGAKVDQKLREAVDLRNRMARQLGFRNFYVMQLELGEIGEKELLAMFDELDRLTVGPFTELKKEIDSAAAKRYGVAAADLRPWHYGDLFFQDPPASETTGLETVYHDRDLVELARTYYAGIGLDVEGILKRSDLYEKPGKTPHAFACDIDRADDIRIMCNLKPNLYWADTLLHELGHAVYDQYIDRDLPFILRTPAHSMTTEGVAMLLGAMSKNEEFLAKVLKLPPEKAGELAAQARRALRSERLVFSRWAQVMVRFELAMYDQPDQDLGKLWWDLKKRYQLLNPPEDVSRPDYGAKNHIVTTPAYYHNYMLGELFACQTLEHMASKIVGASDPHATCFFKRQEAGAYLKEQIFRVGNRYPWNELTRRATGEPLSPKAYARQVAPSAGSKG